MSTKKGGSRIPWATRSSSPTDSTISSATSRPKRQRDLPHEDDRSDHPCSRSSCMRATTYRRLFAHDASSQGVVRQTDREIHGSASHTLRSSISNPGEPAEA
ncbi:hypothetical protein PIB30_008359 [Stylosanthes scabra]|uniref:Uncharacterized protein n=1 Tax=Stylosanthes scabra TaxID=79078 RepID=A0ABU6U4T4_9FABA|nr:hypothetical protein [Stylosanthes scabra]